LQAKQTLLATLSQETTTSATLNSPHAFYPNIPNSQQGNAPLGLLDAAGSARENGVIVNTHEKSNRSLRRWIEFADQFEFSPDNYMENLDESTRIRMLGAFCESVRQGNYTRGRDADNPLLGSTAKEHVKQVAAAFMAADRPDPRLDRLGNNSKLLHRQYKGYENLNRPTKHEKELTAPVFIRMWELTETPKENYLAHLAIGAFYHAMRSCEYLKVQGERRTKVLCLHNLRFFRGL
jgi:hypothetical protein